MSERRRGVFPVDDSPITTPSWLRNDAAGQPVENLLERLKPGHGGSSAQPAPTAPGDAKAHKEPERRPAPDPRRDAGRADRAPPAPRMPRISGLGALAPGARSIVPPAADGSEGRLEGINAFADAVTELAIARASVLAAVEGDLLNISLKIAAAMIETEVEHNPALHAVLVQAALRTLGDCTRVRLHTSNEAYAALVEHMGGPKFDVNGISVELVRDASIPGLGCMIDEEHARVDATVAERLRSVRIAFEDERRRKPEGFE